jgi:hypothetical protein
MRITLVSHMHNLGALLPAAGNLPHPHDRRGFFTTAQMAQIIGRPPRWTDGSALHLLGWTRTVRRVCGVTQRVWFPPTSTIEKPTP